jgi:hypothetical protein
MRRIVHLEEIPVKKKKASDKEAHPSRIEFAGNSFHSRFAFADLLQDWRHARPSCALAVLRG